MLDSPEPSVEEVSHKTLQYPLSLISRKSARPAPGCSFELSCSHKLNNQQKCTGHFDSPSSTFIQYLV